LAYGKLYSRWVRSLVGRRETSRAHEGRRCGRVDWRGRERNKTNALKPEAGGARYAAKISWGTNWSRGKREHHFRGRTAGGLVRTIQRSLLR